MFSQLYCGGNRSVNKLGSWHTQKLLAEYTRQVYTCNVLLFGSPGLWGLCLFTTNKMTDHVDKTVCWCAVIGSSLTCRYKTKNQCLLTIRNTIWLGVILSCNIPLKGRRVQFRMTSYIQDSFSYFLSVQLILHHSQATTWIMRAALSRTLPLTTYFLKQISQIDSYHWCWFIFTHKDRWLQHKWF